MKVPLSWLKDYVDVALPVAELARRLTLAGHEVAEIQSVGGSWDNVVIGRITLVNPYNGQTEELKPAKIRGVVSAGMICSEKELGISDNHEGILVLPAEAKVGTPLAEYLGDTVLDIEVTANRPDCLSVVGIAREVAALTGQKMHIPEISYAETGDPIAEQVSIEIADPDLCPRYCATLITGVKIADSPPWMQERLTAGGQRPINNIVDITNYVMLEYGQPLHSFDYTRLKGRKIVPRRAAAGEKLGTDQVEDEKDEDEGDDGGHDVDGRRSLGLAGPPLASHEDGPGRRPGLCGGRRFYGRHGWLGLGCLWLTCRDHFLHLKLGPVCLPLERYKSRFLYKPFGGFCSVDIMHRHP